jgi:8-oxo-dGTP pyrophosphatase MutT (NUDIX family)
MCFRLVLGKEKNDLKFKTTNMCDSRPKFTYKNQIYVSAGVVPYTLDKHGNYYLLLQRLTNDSRQWTYEDFGGKSEEGDQSIEDVAFRECYEETNYIETFTPQYLKQQLEDSRSVIYRISSCKYMLYLIYVPPELKDTLDLAKFGIENDDKQPRVLEWLSYKSVMELDDEELQPRFNPREFKDNLSLLLSLPIICSDQKCF